MAYVGTDRFVQIVWLLLVRENHRQSSALVDSDGAAAGVQGCLVGGGIDAGSQPAGYRQPGLDEAAGKTGRQRATTRRRRRGSRIAGVGST